MLIHEALKNGIKQKVRTSEEKKYSIRIEMRINEREKMRREMMWKRKTEQKKRLSFDTAGEGVLNRHAFSSSSPSSCSTLSLLSANSFPNFYHCEVVRDPHLQKRIAKKKIKFKFKIKLKIEILTMWMKMKIKIEIKIKSFINKEEKKMRNR